MRSQALLLRIAKTKIRFLIWGCLVTLLTQCAITPFTSRSIEGKYEMLPLKEGTYFGGQWVILKNGEFTYGIFTDALGDPRLRQNPKHGKYTLNGCLLTLHFTDNTPVNLILTPSRGRYLMWFPQQYEEFLQTHKMPDGVMCQK